MARTNIARGWRLLARKITGRPAPFEINIHITDKCNLRCTYCYSNFYARKLPDLSLADCTRIIAAFDDLGVFEVSLIGGEPLLHPDFSALVREVKDRGLLCSVVTNGYFLPRHVEAVKRLDMVCVSLDGPEAVNDLTRGPGSYRAALRALALLRDLGVHHSMRTTLHKRNLAHLDEIVALAEKENTILNFGLLFPQSTEDGQGKGISRETPPDEEYRQALEKLIAYKKSRPHLFQNSLPNLENALRWPTSYTRCYLQDHELAAFPRYSPVPCHGGRAFATIDTDGRLYPCTNLIGAYEAPNVLAIDVPQAWRQINHHHCAACFYLSSVEKNLVAELNLRTLWNLIRLRGLR